MKALRPALQDKQFSPAYYLHGEDEFLKEDALRHLIDAAADPATRDFNLDQRKGGDVDAASLASLLGTPPMMAERRVIVIRDAPALKKDAAATLVKYLGSPASDVVVVLTAAAEDKPTKPLSTLAVAVDCKSLSGVQVPKWITARVSRLGATISDSAVELLQETIGSDLGELAIALDKLASYCGGRTIEEDDVTTLVGVRREETAGRLLDAIAMRDVTLAISLVPGVLRQPKTGAVPIVMMLTTQMLAIAAMRARNLPASRLSNEYWGLLKRGGSNLTGRSWGDAVAAWVRATDQWTVPELDYALEILLQTDRSLKDSRVSSDEQILSSAILSMCRGASSTRAA
jgi:DNA polymerase III subunit delta